MTTPTLEQTETPDAQLPPGFDYVGTIMALGLYVGLGECWRCGAIVRVENAAKHRAFHMGE